MTTGQYSLRNDHNKIGLFPETRPNIAPNEERSLLGTVVACGSDTDRCTKPAIRLRNVFSFIPPCLIQSEQRCVALQSVQVYRGQLRSKVIYLPSRISKTFQKYLINVCRCARHHFLNSIAAAHAELVTPPTRTL